MLITKLEKEKRNSKIRIYIDDIYAFSLYPGEVHKNLLAEYEEINQEKLQKLSDHVIKRARQYAFNLLSRREYTASELVEKIQKSGVAINDAKKLVNRLEISGYINDKRYAERYIENMSQKKSLNAIKHWLKNKGIDISILEQILTYNQDLEQSVINKIIEKKLNGVESLDGKAREKIIRHLLYKGFNYSDIQKAIDEYYNNIE